MRAAAPSLRKQAQVAVQEVARQAALARQQGHLEVSIRINHLALIVADREQLALEIARAKHDVDFELHHITNALLAGLVDTGDADDESREQSA